MVVWKGNAVESEKIVSKKCASLGGLILKTDIETMQVDEENKKE